MAAPKVVNKGGCRIDGEGSSAYDESVGVLDCFNAFGKHVGV